MRYPYRQKTNNASKEARIIDNQNVIDIADDIRDLFRRIDNILLSASKGELQANDARLDALGTLHASLKARLDADYFAPISATRLKTTTDADKIQLFHLADSVIKAIAGTAAVNPVIGDKTVGLEKLTFNPVVGVKSKNLFDKSTVFLDKYINFSTGQMLDSPSQQYVASDFISVNSSKSYAFGLTYQSAWYDTNKTFISGFNPANATYVVKPPSNAAYLRVSVLKTNVATYQIEEGTKQTTYQSFGNILPAEALGNQTVEEKNFGNVLLSKFNKTVKAAMERTLAQFVRDELEHPSKPVQFKVLGSSSVAGRGGTGYSATGEAIGSTGYKANEAGYCWVNQFKRYVETTYNKARNEVGIDNRFFTIEGEGPEISGSARWAIAPETRLGVFRRLFGLNTKITIPFYGDAFEMYYAKGSSVYNMNLQVDGVQVDIIPGTDTVTSYSNNYKKTGFGSGYHEAVITPIQNGVDATTGRMIIESLVFTKKAVVKNWAVSGTGMSWLLSNKSSLIEADDTIVWEQMGVNDRSNFPYEGFKELQRQFIDYVKGLGKEIVLSSSQPVRNESDAAATYFKLIDIDTAFKDLSRVEGVYFASNYQPLIRHLQINPTVSIESLTVDALHPNDEGYRIIFEGLMEQLEMPVLKREDPTLG
ncbi:SGNH/GDSL hydrolase family protein [Priestia megaterium]|uniref:SGNH/GDSL hydrolase family protein n=1 Tax=Priestia megaterium TaxID=1404 RepID=UPI000BA5DBD0|nr:SGNH/GDSL hydrolase family protein [Priestia megaterium]PAK49594.1 hypothetical protein CHH47_12700 [Priestia megaterium]